MAADEHLPRRRVDEAGMLMVWFGLSLTALLGISGFALDLGNWYLHIQRAQRAADAAALAGNSFLPADLPAARQAAKDSLAANGVPLAELNASFASTTCTASTKACIAQVPGRPAQLEVRVKTTATNAFLQFLTASKQQTFSRRAIASHRAELHITSQTNALGGPEPSDAGGACTVDASCWGPTGSATSADNNYWLQMSGPATSKVEGDRFNSLNCTPNATASYTPDGCSPDNDEYDPTSNGYLFVVDLRKSATVSTAWLELQAYDPEMTESYDASVCTGAKPESRYCPDDELYGKSGSQLAKLKFTLTGSAASTSPIVGCKTFSPRVGPVTPVWEPICNARVKVDLSKDSKLYLRIRTSAGFGTNHFMLRAGVFSSPSGGSRHVNESRSNVWLSAFEHMPIYNATNSTSAISSYSRFIIGQVRTEWAGQDIHFQFWDVGDATDIHTGADSTGTLSLWGSATVNAALTGNCEYKPPPNLPYSPATKGPSGCGFDVNRSSFNGQLVDFIWHVPKTFTCSASVSCVLMVQMNMSGDVTDDTTTSVLEPGQPLRLVK